MNQLATMCRERYNVSAHTTSSVDNNEDHYNDSGKSDHRFPVQMYLTTIAHHHLPAQPLLSHNIYICSIAIAAQLLLWIHQSISGNKVPLNSNSVGQAINVPNWHDASEEHIPSPDDGACDDDDAVDDGVV